MSTMRTVFIAGLLITTSFFISQSFGSQLGLLQDSTSFEKDYPTGTNWTTDGTLTNVIVNSHNELEIDNSSISGTSFDYRRLSEVDTEENFKTYSKDTQNLQYLSQDDVDLSDYWTKSNSSNSQALAYWYSNNFYAQSGNVTIEYGYREISAPGSAELILYDEDADTQVDSTTLTPGQEAQDYRVIKELQANSDGIHSIRVEIDNGAFDEQRFFHIEAAQKSEDVSEHTSGIYESDILVSSDDTYIERVEYIGDQIQNEINNPQQNVLIKLEGLKDGNVVREETLRASNSLKTETDIFARNNITTDSIRFDVVLASETSTSPKLQSLSIQGQTADQVASDEVSFYIEIALVMVLIGMALLYLVKG